MISCESCKSRNLNKWDEVKQFELGKYYLHTSGTEMAIIAEVESTFYGKCFVAESSESLDFKPVGMGEGYSDNWKEISREDLKFLTR